MTREIFHSRLKSLQDEILILGGMVENALAEAIQTLKARDMAESQRLISDDRHINEKRFAIEEQVLTLIATQQPVARDLRILAGMLEIATELERMGDYAKGIAKINIKIGEGVLIISPVELVEMTKKAGDMLQRALDAFVRCDADLARSIAAEDDQVDELYNQIYHELLKTILADPKNTDQATFLLWVAHNLERTADRVINICERVIFTVTGDMRELDQDNESDQNLVKTSSPPTLRLGPS
jgi:phosphate transport system protein